MTARPGSVLRLGGLDGDHTGVHKGCTMHAGRHPVPQVRARDAATPRPWGAAVRSRGLPRRWRAGVTRRAGPPLWRVPSPEGGGLVRVTLEVTSWTHAK